MTNSFHNSCNKPNCCGGQCKCQGKCMTKITCPKSCPKFNNCHAAVCPIDQDWHKRKHISGDKCCVYLLELSKHNAKANFAGAGLEAMHEAISEVRDEILSSSASIKRTYVRASTTGSRLKPIKRA